MIYYYQRINKHGIADPSRRVDIATTPGEQRELQNIMKALQPEDIINIKSLNELSTGGARGICLLLRDIWAKNAEVHLHTSLNPEEPRAIDIVKCQLDWDSEVMQVALRQAKENGTVVGRKAIEYDVGEMRKLAKKFTIARIADMMGMSVRTVARRMKENGIKAKPYIRRRKEEGKKRK